MVGITSNPIVRLEFLRRFRSSGAAWGIPLLTLLPGIAVSVAYTAGTRGAQQSEVVPFGPGMAGGDLKDAVPPVTGVTVEQVSNFGLPMYVALMAAVLVTLLVLIPAVVGGSISSERNNNTLQPLQLTALRALDIVMGKLVASLAYLLLLLLCLSPVMVTPFLVGGVRILDVVRGLGLLLLVCVELAAVSIAVSAVLARAVTSIIASLLITGALVVGPFIAMWLVYWVQSYNGGAIDELGGYSVLASLSPVSLFSWSGRIEQFDVGRFAGLSNRVLSLIFWALVTIGALVVACRAVRAPVAKDR